MRVVGFVGDKSGKANTRLLQALNGRLPQPLLNLVITGNPDGIPDQEAGQVAYSFQRSLRELVDEWIESGRTEEAENPWDRVAPLASLSYVERNHPVLSMDARGPYLILVPWKEEKSFAASIVDGALAIFVQFLDSPECRRLFRCDGCGTYFMRQRMPKKDTPIKRGSYCQSCKGNGKDRIRRTEDSRAERTGQMIRLAADAWPQWKQDRRHGERTEWVAQQVNKRLMPKRDPIKKNWVTMHQDEIEAEVERRKHA